MKDPTENNSLASDRLLKADEVARHVGMTPNWIYSETRKGRIPHIKLGRYRRYRASTINRWLIELEGSPTAEIRHMGPSERARRC